MAQPTTSTSSPTYPIEFLCKLIPHDFSGNRFELGQFIANCNNANGLANDSQKLPLLYFILSKISGKAKEQLAQQNFDTWDNLKDKLKILYQDKKHYCQLMEELNNSRQNFNESITDYFQRLEMLNSRAISAARQYTENAQNINGKIETINEITLNRFVYHSIPQISQMLRWKDFNNLNSAYTAAVTEERALNIRNTSKFCKICRKSNHDTSNCRFKQKFKVNTIQNSSNNNNTLKNNTSQNQTYSKFCNYCKKNGHVINECRKLKYKRQNEKQVNVVKENNKVHLNYQQPPMMNATLVDQINFIKAFEN